MSEQGEQSIEQQVEKRLLEEANKKIERLEDKLITLATELQSYKTDRERLINIINEYKRPRRRSYYGGGLGMIDGEG